MRSETRLVNKKANPKNPTNGTAIKLNSKQSSYWRQFGKVLPIYGVSLPGRNIELKQYFFTPTQRADEDPLSKT
jgi:hypothetical protein